MNNVPVLIPSFNPDRRLTELVKELVGSGVKNIIVVNDGSREECGAIFAGLEKLPSVTLLSHAVNLGKGRALKTGLNHFYLHYPRSPGVVTADGDGQHRPADILSVARGLTENPGHLIMGARQMHAKIPFRSLFGNLMTRFVFSGVTGRRISDTQSGLRGLPREWVPRLLKIKGERYEYEINMLIQSKRQAVNVLEIPIETIYIDDNQSSHFNPLWDSMRIYFQLLRFGFSSLLASLLDFIVFGIVYHLSGGILLSMFTGRFLVGSLFNYIINRRLVFHSRVRVVSSLLKYYTALVLMSLTSYLLIEMVVERWGFRVTNAKILVESLLFVFNFIIQRELVFEGHEEQSEETE